MLDITVRTGTGLGRTLLSSFDTALLAAGVANYNLIRLSSVIPADSRLRVLDDPGDAVLEGRHGDRLYCVYSEAYAEHPGEIAWAGLGWCHNDEGEGLFVEHHGGAREIVEEQIQLSLADMSANRGGGYGPPQMALTSVHCDSLPVCALAIAVYEAVSW